MRADKRTHKTWSEMRQRCNNPHKDNYKYYGGRGIKVCERWGKYKNFLSDMGERPEGTTLDRIDGDGDYTKDNCRWADRITQANNYSNNRLITALGKTQTLSQWSREIGLSVGTIWARLNSYGFSQERAITEKRCAGYFGRISPMKRKANLRIQGKIS